MTGNQLEFRLSHVPAGSLKKPVEITLEDLVENSSFKQITLTRPDDWHLHLRDGSALSAVLPHTARQFARAIVMPNLRPPVTTVAAAADYRDRILAALPGGADFQPLMTLYLTDNTPVDEIRRAAESGFVHAVKLYPAGATTNSDAGVTDLARCDAVLTEMSRLEMPLLVHGARCPGHPSAPDGDGRRGCAARRRWPVRHDPAWKDASDA
jgi:hypothetical protein